MIATVCPLPLAGEGKGEGPAPAATSAPTLLRAACPHPALSRLRGRVKEKALASLQQPLERRDRGRDRRGVDGDLAKQSGGRLLVADEEQAGVRAALPIARVALLVEHAGNRHHL